MRLEGILPQVRTGVPAMSLAPMQDVTTRRFMELISEPRYGAPDLFVTEFLRVHATSDFDDEILEIIAQKPVREPLFLQLVGEDISALSRIATATLSRFKDLAGIDFNLGCPMPKIFRKNVGGGLLRDLDRVAEILPVLRKITADFGKLFSVKCRIGFDDASIFPRVIEITNENGIDVLSVHGRTVIGLYRSPVDYNAIAFAVEKSTCPVFANGEISSVKKAKFVLKKTQCMGFMIGRHAVRNPWIFRQIREAREGGFFEIPQEELPEGIFQPRLSDVFEYIRDVAECVKSEGDEPPRIAAKMKKFLNFIGTGIDERGEFLFAVRRAETPDEIFSIAEKFLLTGGKPELPFPAEPYLGVVARPNYET